MSRTHRFTVNVPNPEPKSVKVELELRPASAADLRRLLIELPKARLKVEEAGISLDPCELGEPELRLRPKARSSIDVYVTVVTESGSGGMVALNLVDLRGGKEVGGVLLVCTDPPAAEQPGQEVPASAPCPATLARSPYAVECDADPSKAGQQTILAGETVDLVAQITSPRSRPLTGVTVYLEHLGGSDVRFAPANWRISRLEKGEVFYATWRITATAATPGSFEASIVVQSTRTEPTRLKAPIRIGAPPEEKPGNRSKTRKRAKAKRS